MVRILKSPPNIPPLSYTCPLEKRDLASWPRTFFLINASLSWGFLTLLFNPLSLIAISLNCSCIGGLEAFQGSSDCIKRRDGYRSVNYI